MAIASPPISIGPFDLLEPIGRGGMSVVWRGVHRHQNVPVAVKVMTGERLVEPRFRAAFEAEVRAVAGLDHPGVVMVLDQGVLGRDAAQRMEDVRPGSPFLVMELARMGTVRDLQVASWKELRALLLAVLDALAHAHACGVVHRDLKPANILICAETDARPGPKLSDFGVAAAIEERESEESIERPMGTPAYMAPEQFAGRWRDYGPWTDIYSLGVVAYELIAGARPFRGNDLMTMATQHVTAAPPAIVPRFEVPVGMEAWVLRALSKEPALRFSCAADAAWTLLSLPGVRARQPRKTFPMWAVPADGGGASTTIGFDLLLDELETQNTPVVDPRTERGGAPLGPVLRPPLPPTWRKSKLPSLPPRLVDVGLGLWGLRRVPFVGRVAERDALWAALREVRATQTTRVVVVEGPAGVGKTRLVDSICTRAHEVGGARVLRATHPAGSTDSGIGPMVARHLRCHGLPPDRVLHRVRRLMRASGVEDVLEWATLAALVAPSDSRDTRLRRASLEERFASLHRLLARASQERPVIVWIDDAHRGGDAAAFVLRALQDVSDALPVLFVLSRRVERADSRPIVAALIELILQTPGVQRLTLGPLSEGDHQAFVGRLLALEPALLSKVVRRTQGNPLFAVQLIGELVSGGRLEVRETGFGLVAGASVRLPDDLHQLWLQRLRAVLTDQAGGAPDLLGLEIAAALGSELEMEEWEAAAALAGSPLHAGVPHALVDGGLMAWDASGRRLTFVHAALRESLLRHASDGGRLRDHHRLCAKALLALHAESSAERRGYHLARGRADRDALQPLLVAATRRFEMGEFALAVQALDLREAALGRLPDPDPVDKARGWILRARILKARGDVDAAAERADEAAGVAAEAKARVVMARALLVLGQISLWKGRLDDAVVYFEKCGSVFEEKGELSGRAAAHHGMGDVLVRRGQTEAAVDELRSALRVYNILGQPESYERMTTQLSLGRAHVVAGAYDEAGALYRQVASLARELGSRFALAEATNGLGEIYRARRSFEEARRCYSTALDLYRRLGSSGRWVPFLNLALVDLLTGDYEEAEHKWDAARVQGTIFTGYVLAGKLPCLAARGDWDAMGPALGQTRTELLRGRTSDPDKAWPVELAGELAMAAGQGELAAAAFSLAAALWGALGMEGPRTRALEREGQARAPD